MKIILKNSNDLSNAVRKLCGTFTCINCKQHETNTVDLTFRMSVIYRETGTNVPFEESSLLYRLLFPSVRRHETNLVFNF
jgi:hypothetical protein